VYKVGGARIMLRRGLDEGGVVDGIESRLTRVISRIWGGDSCVRSRFRLFISG
jgi:hypothetical protein